MVDLTGENSDHGPPSQARRLYDAPSTSIPTPTQTLEPDSVDLTQEDDGPIRELYGTFGTILPEDQIVTLFADED